MTTVGIHPVLETQNKPTLVSISSATAKDIDSTKSRASWSLNFPISAEDDDFAAKVSLKSFSFYNTLNKNIHEKNNTLKILTATDNVNSSTYITVKIPTGHYSITTLLAFLNKDYNCNDFIGSTSVSSAFKGLGSVGDTNYPAFFVSSEDPTRICFQGCPLGDYQNPTGNPPWNKVTYTSSINYTGIYLIVDSETIPLLQTLGFISTLAATEATILAIGSNFLRVIGFTIKSNGTTVDSSTYSYSNGTIKNGVSTNYYKGVCSINLSTSRNIAVILDNISQSGRSSYENFRTSNLLAVIPVLNGYGWRCHYEPSNPFKNIVTNFTVNEIVINLVDADTGVSIDFQGANWTMTLEIEYYQIDNSKKNSTTTAPQSNARDSLKRFRA